MGAGALGAAAAPAALRLGVPSQLATHPAAARPDAPPRPTRLQASTAELWPERASALLFAQYFWFRHAFLLGPEGTRRVLAMVRTLWWRPGRPTQQCGGGQRAADTRAVRSVGRLPASSTPPVLSCSLIIAAARCAPCWRMPSWRCERWRPPPSQVNEHSALGLIGCGGLEGRSAAGDHAPPLLWHALEPPAPPASHLPHPPPPAGLLKGLPPGEAAALRARVVSQAAELFPSKAAKRRRTAATAAAAAAGPPGALKPACLPACLPCCSSCLWHASLACLPMSSLAADPAWRRLCSCACAGAGAAAPASLAQRHAAVLGLKAFVLCSPYDVPPWLPDVLMALASGAGVGLGIAEGRRPHAMMPLRASAAARVSCRPCSVLVR